MAFRSLAFRTLDVPFLVVSLAVASCREGSENVAPGGFVPIPASPFASGSCSGPDQTFGSVGAPLFADAAAIGATSRLAAAEGEELVFFTGADGSVRELDFSGGSAQERVLVAPGVIDDFLQGLGISAPAELSGIAVLDPAHLVVAEHASNTLLLVGRDVSGDVDVLAGRPDASPGFADGTAGSARFSFPTGTPAGLLATGDGRVLVADPGNHALRQVVIGPLPLVSTLAGSGAPGFADGELGGALFDTPSGLALTCGGLVLVSETGAAGAGGHRLRAVAIGEPSFFGGLEGSVQTVAGDGTPASGDGPGGATLAAPVAPVSSASGNEAYVVDAGTGILRRHRVAAGATDCPLFPDCAAAVAAGGSFSGPGAYALAVTDSGALLVLDGAAGEIRRIEP